MIAFNSNAFNLVPNDFNSAGDVFVHDRRPAADLALAMTDSPDPVPSRAQLTYVLTITNQGPGSATGVAVTDSLPEQVVFVSAVSSQGGCTRSDKSRRDGTVNCSLGTLAAGSSATVTIVVETGKAGTIVNTATAGANEPDPDTANNTATETTTVF